MTTTFTPTVLTTLRYSTRISTINGDKVTMILRKVLSNDGKFEILA
jgi:hypothetical protein